MCILLCLGLSSIAVGLGAMMPNFRETSPSKISAGFGGTLNLVLSALYIIVIVVLTALPCHFYLIAGNAPWRESFLEPQLSAALAVGRQLHGNRRRHLGHRLAALVGAAFVSADGIQLSRKFGGVGKPRRTRGNGGPNRWGHRDFGVLEHVRETRLTAPILDSFVSSDSASPLESKPISRGTRSKTPRIRARSSKFQISRSPDLILATDDADVRQSAGT